MKAAGWWLIACTLTACQAEQKATLSGYVEAESVRVAASVSGQLQIVAVQRGDTVAVGQTLFGLDSDKEQAAVAEATARVEQAQAQAADLDSGKRPSELAALQADVDSAQASLKAADSELTRQRRLVSQHYLPAANLDTYQAQRDAAAAKVRELQAQLSTAKLASRDNSRLAAQANIKATQSALAQAQWQLDQKQVKALQAGIVDDTYYRAGEWVSAGTPILSILPSENRKVRFFVPEPQLGSIHVGQIIHVSCDACGKPMPLTISYIAPQSEYTPPVIYSKDSRAKLVVMVEALPKAADALRLNVGQPVDVELVP